MSQLTVVLPPDLQGYVDARVAAEGYHDISGFMRDVVRRDQAAYDADVGRVQALLDEGVASGILDMEPEQIINEILADLSQHRG